MTDSADRKPSTLTLVRIFGGVPLIWFAVYIAVEEFVGKQAIPYAAAAWPMMLAPIPLFWVFLKRKDEIRNPQDIFRRLSVTVESLSGLLFLMNVVMAVGYVWFAALPAALSLAILVGGRVGKRARVR
ncbi:hypothetical protein [Streptomyces olivaceiscleroticus]|uniref:DUF2568 domain-containing protein n=1 Tax=Streptomyces olivaceiscleroticus TaxID=68245 RepID=A0ABN0ZRM3_9ACTN